MLAVGLTESQACVDKELYKTMYSESKPWFQRTAYTKENECLSVMHTTGDFKVTGSMGTTCKTVVTHHQRCKHKHKQKNEREKKEDKVIGLRTVRADQWPSGLYPVANRGLKGSWPDHWPAHQKAGNNTAISGGGEIRNIRFKG